MKEIYYLFIVIIAEIYYEMKFDTNVDTELKLIRTCVIKILVVEIVLQIHYGQIR